MDDQRLDSELARLRAELAAIEAYVATRTQALEARIAEVERQRAAPAAEAPQAVPTATPVVPATPEPAVAPSEPPKSVVTAPEAPRELASEPAESTAAPKRAVFKIDDALPAATPEAPAAEPAATPLGARSWTLKPMAPKPADDALAASEPAAETAAETAEPPAPAQPAARPRPTPTPRPVIHAEPAEPSRGDLVRTGLLSAFAQLLGPLGLVLEKCRDVHEHYRAQGKTAVFFLTLAGLLAMVGGFGYLLQYSFAYLTPTIKVALGFVASAAISGFGGWLARRKPEFLDYASSLVGLGVVFAYLCAYFMGPYFGLAGETVSFLTWAGVTAAAYVLALIFETRVVAAITLVGGALTPFVLGQPGPLGTEFLVYLLLLSAASLHLARRIVWPVLAHLAFVLSLGLIEYAQVDATAGPWTVTALLHGFFYLYTYFWSCTGRRLRLSVEAIDLGALTANLFYFIYAMSQAGLPPLALGTVFAVDAGVLLAVYLALGAGRSPLAAVLSSQITLLIACAIFMVAPEGTKSVLWAAEGLTLVWLGRHYRAFALRVEGYFVLLPSLLGLALLASDGIVRSGLALGAHWIALAAIGGTLYGAYKLIDGMADEEARGWERAMATVLKELFSAWGLVAFYAVAGLALGRQALVLAGLPLLWAFWRARRHRLALTEMLALGQLGLVATYLALDVLVTRQPYALAYGPWYWAALVEFVIGGWGVYALYTRYYADGQGIALARAFRVGQYALPVAWLAAWLVSLLGYYLRDGSVALWSPLSLDLALLGGWLGLAGWRLWRETRDDGPGAGMFTLVREAQSIWFSVVVFYVVDVVAPGWAPVAAIVPAGLLLWRGVARSLVFTEMFAWVHLGVFAVMIVLGGLKAGSFHLEDQTWPTRLAWLELSIAGWGGLWIYQRAGRNGTLLAFAQGMRTLVYLALPLVFLPKVARHWPEYLTLAAWASSAICWALHRATREAALRVELWLLVTITAFYSAAGLWFALAAGSGGLATLAGVVAGAAFFIALCGVEGGFRRGRFQDSEFRLLVTLGAYYLGLAVLALGYTLSTSVRMGMLAAGGFFFLVSLRRPIWPPLRGTVTFAHSLGWVALAVAVLSLWGRVNHPWLDGGVAVVALIGLGYVAHARRPLRIGWRHEGAAYLTFHALVLATYTALTQVAFGDAGAVATTIALVLHATALLFLTLAPRFALLIKPSVALFAAAAVKILFYDMTGFSTLHKVIALMTIGAILLVAAYQFQRLKQRLAPTG